MINRLLTAFLWLTLAAPLLFAHPAMSQTVDLTNSASTANSYLTQEGMVEDPSTTIPRGMRVMHTVAVIMIVFGFAMAVISAIVWIYKMVMGNLDFEHLAKIMGSIVALGIILGLMGILIAAVTNATA